MAQDAAEEAPPTRPLAAEDLESIGWRPLGPSTFGGRIVDLALHPDHPRTLWVASASGGLFVTRDHGTTFECLFENEGTISIGDIAVDPNDANVLWIGTGEANNQRSSYWGDGVYKSTDGGETWANVGLPDSQHIGRIVIDPRDSSRVFVAALGALYTSNEERGLYRTTDGGETWEQVLAISADVGVCDVALDPNNPDHMVAASYERRRRAWDFDGNGPGSGIWHSNDGGSTWERSSEGLPTGDIGRIGLDVFPGEENLIVATVSNQNRVPVEAGPVIGLLVEWTNNQLVVTKVKDDSGAEKLGLKEGDVLKKIGDRELDDPFAWMHVLGELRDAAKEKADESGDEPELELTYVRDDEEKVAVADLENILVLDEKDPETREAGGEIYVSSDYGATWTKVNEEPVGGSPAYYYGQIRFDPNDAKRLYMCGVPMLASSDGGANWERIAGSVHVDHHAVLVDPNDSHKVWLGNDGGLHVSYDRGEKWQHFTNLPISQFYAVGLDNSEPFRVFGGTQDNGTWGGPNTSRDPRGIHPMEWFSVGGGDGFYAQVDPRNPQTVYGESQFGFIYRRNLERGTSVRIRPAKPKDAEEESLRFNWNSPILISAHNPEVIYFGGNRLFKSFNRGDTWAVHSPDLTTKDAEKIAGNVPHCTITTIAESVLDPGLLLVGTDDGLVQMSANGGYEWTNLTGQFPGAPSGWWVSRVTLSDHDRSTAYASFTGYREDDFRPLVFRTTELGSGKGWQRISDGLPDGEPVNDIVEDSKNPNVLYAATEFGVHVSCNHGETWTPFGAELPRVPIHDLAVQGRDGVLVAATHGRGFWAVDVNAVRAFSEEALAEPAHLFPVADRTRWARRSAVGGYGGGDQVWRGENESSDASLVVSIQDVESDWDLTIEDDGGATVATLELPKEAGVHRITWDLRKDLDNDDADRRGRRVSTGVYTAVLRRAPAEGADESAREDSSEDAAQDAPKEQRQRFRIRRDPLLDGASAAEVEGESAPDIRD